MHLALMFQVRKRANAQAIGFLQLFRMEEAAVFIQITALFTQVTKRKNGLGLWGCTELHFSFFLYEKQKKNKNLFFYNYSIEKFLYLFCTEFY